MSNPNNAMGTNGAFGGRTSVNAFNDVLSAFNGRGVLSGWKCSPSGGMVVEFGGDGENRDVAIAEDNAGNKTTVNNISQEPVELAINSAPATNSRVDAVVAYIEDSPSTSGETDNYSAVNILDVNGVASSSPTAPSDSDIRTAITSDGASGATCYYVVLAYITIAAGTTDIDSTMIAQGGHAYLINENIGDSTITTAKIKNAAVTSDKVDWTITSRTATKVSGAPIDSGTAEYAQWGKIVIARIDELALNSGAQADGQIPLFSGFPLPASNTVGTMATAVTANDALRTTVRISISASGVLQLHWTPGSIKLAKYTGRLVYFAK